MNAREDQVIPPLNEWIGWVFGRENIDKTAAALLASQDTSADGQRQRERVKRRLNDAETRLRWHQAAIEAGVNPAALVDLINDAEIERAAAQSELDNMPKPEVLTDAQVYAMIDSLGDVGAALARPTPERLGRLYESLRLELRYEPDGRAVLVTASPRSANERVRGPSCAFATRPDPSH